MKLEPLKVSNKNKTRTAEIGSTMKGHIQHLKFLSSSVSKSLRKWTQTDTKVTFHPPPATHHPPTHQETFFGLK